MLQTSLNKKASSIEKANKDTYFNQRWSRETGFDKQIDRSNYELSEEVHVGAEVADHILASYKSGGGSQSRESWMKNLTNNALSFIADQRGMRVRAVRQEAQRYQASKTLLEELFALLQVYSFDFNQSTVWTSLQVTATKPAFVTEVLRYNKLREPVETVTTFRARLSTRFLSLVIVGRKDSIEFRLLPVEEVIGLSKAEAAYEPFTTIESQDIDGSITWTIGEHELTPANLETVCMELFTVLIEQTKLEAAKNNSY